MAKKEDRRVQRTQHLLREALFSLIREKGFEALYAFTQLKTVAVKHG